MALDLEKIREERAKKGYSSSKLDLEKIREEKAKKTTVSDRQQEVSQENNIIKTQRNQNIENLKNAALSDKDFKRYSIAGLQESIINNSKDVAAEKGYRVYKSPNQKRDDSYLRKMMSEEETDIYNYYLGKFGKDKAEEYYDAIAEDINKRYAELVTGKNKDNVINQYIYGAAAGLENFKEGTKNAIRMLTGDEEYQPTTAYEYGSQMTRDNLADSGPQIGGMSVGQVGYDLVNNTANMLPSMAIGLVTGGLGGSVAMGLSAAGNTYQQDIKDGYTEEQARKHGILVGAAEGSLQYLLGGIGTLGGKLTTKTLGRFMPKLKSALARVAVKLPASMASEGFEEYSQEILDTVFRNWILDENNDIDLLSEEAIYSGILGALTAGFLEGPSVAINETFNAKYDEQFESVKAGIKEENAKSETKYTDEEVSEMAQNIMKVMGGTATEENIMELAGSKDEKAVAERIMSTGRATSDFTIHKDAENYLIEHGVGLKERLTTSGKKQIEKANQMLAEERQAKNRDTVLKNGYTQEQVQNMSTEDVAQVASEIKQNEKMSTDLQTIAELSKDKNEGYQKVIAESYELYAQNEEPFKMDAEQFTDEFSTFYDFGKAGIESVDKVFEAFPTMAENPVLKNALEQAYVLGRGEAVTEAMNKAETKQSNIDAKLQAAKTKGSSSVGSVRLATEAELSNPKIAAVGGKVVTKGRKLSRQHRATMQFVREFAKLSGINVVLYEGGKSRGWYDSVNNEIYLNIEEGMNLKTLSHELTHFIQQHSPKHYEEFKQFLLDYYRGTDKLEKLLYNQGNLQEDLSQEELEDEIVANACQMFIFDTEAMQELINTQSKGLIETITRWFKNMCEYLRQAFEGVKASHPAAKALEEDIEILEQARDKWYELLNESITVNKQIGTNVKNQAQNYDESKQKFEIKDSEGNELSQKQAEFFKDSKVRDENGNLLVMYHGTPNAGFTQFKSGTYFTQNKGYAEIYKNQGASSLSYKRTADNPDVYSVYINIKKPFDTRNPKERQIFMQEFYGQWGTGAPLADSGLPDWVDGMDLQEFIEENGYDYDGLILDEGAVGGYGDKVVSRGLSYVVFSSEQVKNVDNKAPTKDPDIRFEIKEDFYKEYDAWDKKDTNKTFVVGITSEALKSVGVKEQNIVLRSGTVLQKIKNHKEMTFDKFREIPDLLENPVIIQFSDAIDTKTKKPKYESRITVLGEVYADGKPVLVSLELLPTNQKKTVVLDFAVITSAYKKEALQQYINENTILYIDPNKKRTDKWLSLNRLQLPLGENQYGSIRKIAYSDGKVKVQKSKNATAIQKAMEKAGVVDDYGNFKFELKDEDANRLEILENQEERLVNDLKTLEKYYGDAIRQVYEQDIKPNEGISKRAEELNRKAARRFMNEVGAMFHVPKDTREEYLLPIINEIIDKGPAISESEGLIERLYQTAYEHTEDYIVDTDPEGNYKNLRDYIRKTSIFVNAGTKADIGDYNSFRKHNMGSLRLTSDQTALGLDEFYEEVSNLAPEIFSGSQDGAEQLYELSAFMKDRGRTESIGDFMPQAEYTAWADETLEPELNKLFDSTIGSFLSEASRKEGERKRAAKVDKAMENVTGAIQNYEAAQDYARAEGFLAGQIEQGKKMSAEMRRMQESFERKAKNYEDMIAAKRAEIKKVRERRDEILAERRAAFEAYKEKRNNTIRNGALRKRIERTVKKLNDKLVKPTDIKHIPEDLKEATAALLENFVNDTSVFPKAKLDALREAYDNIRTSGRDLEELYDEDIANNIKSLKETIDGKRLSELNTEQLKQIYEVVASISHMVSDGNKLFINGRKQDIESFVEDIQVAAMEHGNKKKAFGLLGKPVNYADKFFNYDNIIPPYFFDDIGGGFKKLYDDMLYNGGLVWTQDINESHQFMADIFEKYHVWDWSSKNVKNRNKVLKFKTERGDSVELSVNEALSVYATYKRGMANGDGAAHLMQGGIVVDLKEDNGILSFKSESKKGKPLTVNDIREIISFLTEEQMKCADEIVEYLTVVDGEKRNETSMQLHGYKKFNEKYYFPYHVDSSYVKHEPGQPIEEKGNSQSVTRLKNMGSSKVLAPHANAAVHIGDFFDVVAQSMEETANYHGYALIQDNFMRVLNYKNAVNKEGFEGSSGVAQAIKDAYGDEAYKYINKLMGDIFGGPVQIEKDMLMGMFNNFKKTSVVANLSVTVQQPSAIIRAFTEIEPKYVLKALNQKNQKIKLNEMFGYSSTAFLKNMGRFDVGTGFTAQQYILKPNLNAKEYLRQTVVMNSKYDIGARDEALGYLTEKADWTTWGWIMNAAWAKIEAETDLEPGSEEFKKVVGRLFDQITNKTQVYDSVLVKSPLARSKNVATQMSAAFMNEPILSYNTVLNGFKRGGKYRKIALTAYTFSQLGNAFLWAFIGALRDDDEDKTYGEKYVKAFTSKFVSNIIPFLNLPYISQIISIIKGFDVENMAYSPITDAIDAVTKAQKHFEKYEYGEGLKELTLAFNLVGLPIRNIVRDFESLFAFDSAPIGSASAKDLWDAAVEGFNETLGIKESKTDGIKSAMRNGNSSKIKKEVNEAIQKYVKEGKTEKQAKQYIKTSLTSYWKPIYINNEKLRAEIRKAIFATGLYGSADDVIKTCNKWLENE